MLQNEVSANIIFKLIGPKNSQQKTEEEFKLEIGESDLAEYVHIFFLRNVLDFEN